ncbi:MAG: DUF4340 domain-containing protein [Opitutales bacterium]
MRLKLTLILVLLNIGLFSYILYLERDVRGPEAASRLVFVPGTLERAEGIAVQGPGLEHPWAARRENERWMVERPVQWPANDYAMERLLNLLRGLRWETRFPVDELAEVGRDLSHYGLGEDAAELVLEGPEGATIIRLGAPTEVGSRIYVLAPEGDVIYVVNRQLMSGVDLTPESLVDRSVIQIPPFEARSLFLQAGENGGVRVELAREGDTWVLRAPIRVAAEGEAVNAALEELSTLEVGEFVAVGPQEAGLASPFLRLNLNGNNRQQTLLLGDLVDPGAIIPRRYAKLEARAAVFTLPAEPFRVWQTAQESLRQRSILSFDPEEVSAVNIRRGERDLNLQRLESGRWQLITTGEDGNLRTLPADTGVMRDLLNDLSSLQALRFVSDAPSNDDLARFGFETPQREVTVRLRSDRTLRLLLGDFVTDQLGDDRINRLYTKRGNNPSVYLSAASILQAVPLNPLHYRTRTVETLPSGAVIEAIRVRDLAADEVLLAGRLDPDGSIAPLDPEAPPANVALLGTLARAFRAFPAQRFIADSFTTPLRLDARTTIPWRFALEAEVRLSGGSGEEQRIERYLLTERLGGITQFAAKEDLGLVFTLPPELIDALHPVLFSRPRPDAAVNPSPPEPAPPLPIQPAPTPDDDVPSE